MGDQVPRKLDDVDDPLVNICDDEKGNLLGWPVRVDPFEPLVDDVENSGSYPMGVHPLSANV